MKNVWSKNVLIGVLVASNIAAAGYIFGEKLNLRAAVKKLFAQERVRLELAKKGEARRGDVDAVDLSPSKSNNEMQVCYEEFLSREPAADEGSVLFHWTLTPTGEIDLLKLVQSDFSDPTFMDCLTTKIKASRQPASAAKQGMIIAHTFKFRRKSLDRAEFDSRQ